MPNWNYDASDYNPDGHFTPIPPGEYRVRIEAAEETTSKAGNEMIKLTLAVSGMNSKLWYYLVFPRTTDENFAQRKMMTNQSLGEIWESFNLKVGDLNVLNWRGKVGAARVKQSPDKQTGEIRSSVAYFLTRKRQENLPAWREPENSGAAASYSAPSAPAGDYGSLRNEPGNVEIPF